MSFIMRRQSLRFDMWLCLLLSFLVSLGTEKIAKSYFEKKYEDHKEEHKVENGEIGGIAGEDIFRAQTIEDLLSHNTFTVVSPGIEYRNKGAGYYKGMYLYTLTLPSGEKVAARINSDSVVHEGDMYSKGDSILPVGRLIHEDLTQDSYFINQIEYKEPLDRKDFYIDMVGEAAIASAEDFVDTKVLMVQLLTIVITFPIFHTIGSKLGIFPYFFAPKEKKEQEWD